MCRILDVFDTALMIDDRVVHGREESHRLHVVITTNVLQRAVRHGCGSQIHVIPIGRWTHTIRSIRTDFSRWPRPRTGGLPCRGLRSEVCRSRTRFRPSSPRPVSS